MIERIKLAVVVAAIIATLLVGYGFRAATHRCPVCPACPELVARSHIERDSVIVHDTVRVVKYAPSITVRTVPAAPTLASCPADSAISYEVIDTMPDAAIIGFSIASRELPDKYLPDLIHTAWYLAKPERIKIISDTLTIQMPALKCPSFRWGREIIVGGICFGVGAGITAIYLLK